MSRFTTIFLVILALAAVTFLVIYEPLTRSRREAEWIDRTGRVLDLDPGAVREIRIVSGEEKMDLKRRGSTWQLGSKSKDRADRALVEKLLATAAALEFYDRIDAARIRSDKDLSEYGLRNPKRQIEFKGDRTMTLFLGKDGASENRLYAKTSETGDVYLIDDDILDQAILSEAQYRDRRLTDLTAEDVDRVIVRRGGAEMEFQQGAGGWRIVKPLQARADPAKVGTYLDRLLGLRITEFVGDDSGDLSIYGLSEGNDEITFLANGSDKRQTLRLGPEKDGAVFGQFTARDSIYKLPPVVRELLAVTPDALRDRRLLPLNLDIVDRIRITTPQERFALQRRDDGWELKKDNVAPVPANPAHIGKLIHALEATEAAAFTPAFGAELAKFGLDNPLVSIEFLSELSENTPEAHAGELPIAKISFGKGADGAVFARIDENPEAMSVPAQFLENVPVHSAGWK